MVNGEHGVTGPFAPKLVIWVLNGEFGNVITHLLNMAETSVITLRMRHILRDLYR